MPALNKPHYISMDIRLQIHNMEIHYGELLSERSIAQKYNVSRGTSRKALKELVDESYLIKIPSIGYKVRGPHTDPIMSVLSQIDDKLNPYIQKNVRYTSLFMPMEEISFDYSLATLLNSKIQTKLFNFPFLTVDPKTKNPQTYTDCYITENNVFSINDYNNPPLNPIILLQKFGKQFSKIKVSMNLTKIYAKKAKKLNLNDGANVLKRIIQFFDNNENIICLLVEYQNIETATSILPVTKILKKVDGFID